MYVYLFFFFSFARTPFVDGVIAKGGAAENRTYGIELSQSYLSDISRREEEKEKERKRGRDRASEKLDNTDEKPLRNILSKDTSTAPTG